MSTQQGRKKRFAYRRKQTTPGAESTGGDSQASVPSASGSVEGDKSTDRLSSQSGSAPTRQRGGSGSGRFQVKNGGRPSDGRGRQKQPRGGGRKELDRQDMRPKGRSGDRRGSGGDRRGSERRFARGSGQYTDDTSARKPTSGDRDRERDRDRDRDRERKQQNNWRKDRDPRDGRDGSRDDRDHHREQRHHDKDPWEYSHDDEMYSGEAGEVVKDPDCAFPIIWEAMATRDGEMIPHSELDGADGLYESYISKYKSLEGRGGGDMGDTKKKPDTYKKAEKAKAEDKEKPKALPKSSDGEDVEDDEEEKEEDSPLFKYESKDLLIMGVLDDFQKQPNVKIPPTIKMGQERIVPISLSPQQQSQPTIKSPIESPALSHSTKSPDGAHPISGPSTDGRADSVKNWRAKTKTPKSAPTSAVPALNPIEDFEKVKLPSPVPPSSPPKTERTTAAEAKKKHESLEDLVEEDENSLLEFQDPDQRLHTDDNEDIDYPNPNEEDVEDDYEEEKLEARHFTPELKPSDGETESGGDSDPQWDDDKGIAGEDEDPYEFVALNREKEREYFEKHGRLPDEAYIVPISQIDEKQIPQTSQPKKPPIRSPQHVMNAKQLLKGGQMIDLDAPPTQEPEDDDLASIEYLKQMRIPIPNEAIRAKWRAHFGSAWARQFESYYRKKSHSHSHSHGHSHHHGGPDGDSQLDNVTTLSDLKHYRNYYTKQHQIMSDKAKMDPKYTEYVRYYERKLEKVDEKEHQLYQPHVGSPGAGGPKQPVALSSILGSVGGGHPSSAGGRPSKDPHPTEHDPSPDEQAAIAGLFDSGRGALTSLGYRTADSRRSAQPEPKVGDLQQVTQPPVQQMMQHVEIDHHAVAASSSAAGLGMGITPVAHDGMEQFEGDDDMDDTMLPKLPDSGTEHSIPRNHRELLHWGRKKPLSVSGRPAKDYLCFYTSPDLTTVKSARGTMYLQMTVEAKVVRIPFWFLDGFLHYMEKCNPYGKPSHLYAFWNRYLKYKYEQMVVTQKRQELIKSQGISIPEAESRVPGEDMSVKPEKRFFIDSIEYHRKLDKQRKEKLAHAHVAHVQAQHVHAPHSGIVPPGPPASSTTPQPNGPSGGSGAVSMPYPNPNYDPLHHHGGVPSNPSAHHGHGHGRPSAHYYPY